MGTVYLGDMPESKQGRLTEELTNLFRAMLHRWTGSLPRLCYVTDAGDNETGYYETVLKRMTHPRTGERVEWVRVEESGRADDCGLAGRVVNRRPGRREPASHEKQ